MYECVCVYMCVCVSVCWWLMSFLCGHVCCLSYHRLEGSVSAQFGYCICSQLPSLTGEHSQCPVSPYIQT